MTRPLRYLSRVKKERRQRIAAMIEDIEREAAESNPRPKGASFRQQAEDPHRRPSRSSRIPAPSCHTSRRSTREAFDDAYAAFVALFRRAARVARQRDPGEAYPRGCFPPARCFLPPLTVAAQAAAPT